jgi:chromosome partitioning protein
MNASETGAATHVIVLGNEKGGSGKSTLAIHLAVSLMLEGMRVVTIDLDARKQTLTQAIRNRRNWAKAQDIFLPTPDHHLLEQAETDSLRTNKWSDIEAFTRLLKNLRQHADFIIIDTPSQTCQLSTIAHAHADTLLTPMNDSMLDLNALAHITPNFGTLAATSPYTKAVQAARHERLAADGSKMDWVVLRNRLFGTDTPNYKAVGDALGALSNQVEFRLAQGMYEREIYREYFNLGLTALDPIESFAPHMRPTMHHMASRNEILNLIEFLNLPLEERGRKRKQAQLIWRQSAALPLELTEILA